MSREWTEITVIGEDDTGLIAEVTSFLFKRNVNILDIDQAVREGTFRMMMQVDTSEMVTAQPKFREDLEDLGDDFGVEMQIEFPSDSQNQSIAVLVTKESHCLERLLEAQNNGELGADIEVVIGNHDHLQPLAEEYDVPFHDVGDEKGTPDEERLLDLLGEYGVDVIALARFIRILSPEVVFRYETQIINVHPSLLPAFPGAAAYRQALEEGARIAGVTAHYVTTDLDQGPIITQRAFNVPSNATEEDMKRLGQPLEAEALLEAIKLHLNDELSVQFGRTELENPDETDAQLGAPDELNRIIPDGPTDGFDKATIDLDETATADD
ncbi:formyltetrahydrofolate deformylase [Halogeometricum pallidum JCM 14848]|uniref:Formyltetrahydrofolate deformylase n=1 Tax=Halogeometricum pallidum JCM 14848 TaxID=1227487 RepID=M0DEK0_HALPD|nr:formyltetrahydrofolate deformylase [Halogeometricum pallidum]ELZ32574.1 formyltetrahydrofolate deformylase [Halogeometricum pallidum JCM 14848]